MLRSSVVLGVLFVLVCVLPLSAQEGNGVSLGGRVLDATGGVIPGATVTAATASGGQARVSAVTDSAGRYEFRNLQPGTYELTAELIGFRLATPNAIKVATESIRALDIRLEARGVAETVTVTATRVATPIAAIPTSVTVLDRDVLDDQTALSRNLHTILGKTLPGFGLSRESESNFGQNLRGRGMLVLLDGVPQNFELRQGALDELSRIDPSRIERIEVVRGASAAYGSEAAGGIINIITGSGARATPALNTELGTTSSATHAGDSGAVRLFQDVGGITGRTMYFAAGGVETTGSAFDADGDRIPEIFPVGLTQTTAVDIGGRVGVRVAPQQQFSASAQMYWARKDEAYGSVDGVAGARPARAIELPVGIGSPAD